MDSKEHERVIVRRLRPDDLKAVIALDARIIGRRREEYFKVKLAQALANTGVVVSLAAELGGLFAGFLLARVYYGEFGSVEQVAMLDTLGVEPSLGGAGVGHALLAQLRTNLLGLGIPVLQTEVAWSQHQLLSFFHHAGFAPAARFCLDLDLRAAQQREERMESLAHM